jgi:uncharacterized protein YciI
MRTLTVLLIAICVFACNNENVAPVTETDSTAGKKDTMQYGEMKMYWLVFLLKGPNRSQDSVTAARLQTAHLNNINRLAKEGVIVMAGPMGYGEGRDEDLRGIFIIDAKDSTEAASYIKSDSAVISGSLRFEVHPWWTAKGNYKFD